MNAETASPVTSFRTAARAAVRNEVTGEAVSAFMEHLDRIVAEAAPEAELNNARRYLSDSFPLQIETAARVARMVAQLRIYELPDNYWDTYRTSICLLYTSPSPRDS